MMVKVVVAAFALVLCGHVVGVAAIAGAATSAPLQITLLVANCPSVDEVANAPPEPPLLLVPAFTYLLSQYSAHSAPLSDTYTAYCDCVAAFERSISRKVMSKMLAPMASAKLDTNTAKNKVKALILFPVKKILAHLHAARDASLV